MRRFYSLLVALIIFNCALQAQSGEKPVVFIDYFSYPKTIPTTCADALRNKVIEGIQNTGRVQLIDVSLQNQLNSEEARRKAESAMSDATARNSEMKTLGAHYIISADIASMTATRQIDDNGNTYYKGSVHWNIKVVNTATGTVEKNQSFIHEGITGKTAGSAEKAIIATSDYAKISMTGFIDDTFPLEGLILKVETASKKGDKAETVIIDLGKNVGIAKGQRFIVYLETDIAGEVARKEIGTLNALDVLSGSRTVCKVAKGGDLIINAMNRDQKLIIVSRKSKLLEF